MRVKRLEIQGFKSFKDKTVIYFDEGITGIVGPNGCGKSNIVDAFFWVMGEQSYKHMRGTSSDDLIFNGSSKYAPLAIAEATLVLETDFESSTADAPSGATYKDIPLHLRSKEISVTRRLYRDGGGEYFINGVQARLKDVQELFMDTGVGAKGYSVIEQGQIGKVVNAKPEERRLLVEEAAGIAKYKARKKESLRKIEATQANLSRLNDVIAEIERNLNSLERQAQKARQYRKYREELLDKEMTWGRRRMGVITVRLEALKSERDNAERELVALRAELQTAENGMEVDRVAQLTDSKSAEEAQTAVARISDELARERSSLELSRRRQTDLQSQLQALETEKAQLISSTEEEKTKLAAAESEASGADARFQEAARHAQATDEQLRGLRQELESARQAVDSSKRELMTSISQASDITSRAAALATRAESARAQAERISRQTQTAKAKLTESRSELEKTQAALGAAKLRRESLIQTRSQHAQELQRLEHGLRETESGRESAAHEVAKLDSRIQSIEELLAAHEGLGSGARAALDWSRERGSAEISALADAFETSAEYETALGGWLEARLESLVARNPDAAMSAIEKLRDGKQGRATIHVSSGGGVGTYNLIRFDSIREMLEGTGFRVIGELGGFAKVNSGLPANVRDIALDAIEHVCVVESMSPLAAFLATSGAIRLGHWSLVSLDGTALDRSGVVRGGSLENDALSSVLRRKRSLSELQAERVALEERKTGIDRAVEAARLATAGARTLLQAVQTELQQTEIAAGALERDVHQMARALREAEGQLGLLESQIRDAEEDASLAVTDRSKLEGRLGEIQSSRAALEATIDELERRLAEKDSVVRAREEETNALRVAEAELRERAVSLKREMEAARSLIADRERRMAEIEKISTRASQEKEGFTGGETALEERIENLMRSLSEKRGELSEVKNRLERSAARLNAALEQIKVLHRRGDERTANSTELTLEFEKLGSEIAHLVQNLEEKYGPGCLERPAPIQEEMSDPVVTAEMTAEEEKLLAEEVERLRERIRRLGELNPNADQEYEEVKKRYDYLTTEKADLERSMKNLEEAIEHINQTSEERFRRAFEAISNRFERLFPVIFGGGSAQLTLVYPEGSTDILEAGVDIMAQPPGKKVSNITLLSGGEKALTAVSLIFAIFMVKPSPFCVLDEVDAPLDDANIGKFNALLREMSAKSQFILITHNKKTMELNDTLYGVTMEEPGVSKMVSIQLH